MPSTCAPSAASSESPTCSKGACTGVGNHLRVTAQLERADNGYQIWSETYDRELGDVFRIQDEIANAVVKALKVSLLGSAVPQSLGTRNSDAYLVFLQGRAKMATQKLSDFKVAATDFARALKLDPNYGPAYVELATARLRLAEFTVTGDRAEAFESASREAKLLIERALALDPNNAQAYVERGYLRAFSDPVGAEKDLRRGIELNPSSARGYAGLATVLFSDPLRRDDALAMLERARRLDPLEPEYDVLKARCLVVGSRQCPRGRRCSSRRRGSPPNLLARSRAASRSSAAPKAITPTPSCTASRPLSSTRWKKNPAWI